MYPIQQVLILIAGVAGVSWLARLDLRAGRERGACLWLLAGCLQCVVFMAATVERRYGFFDREAKPDDPGRPVAVASLKPIDGRYFPPLRPTAANHVSTYSPAYASWKGGVR